MIHRSQPAISLVRMKRMDKVVAARRVAAVVTAIKDGFLPGRRSRKPVVEERDFTSVRRRLGTIV